MSIYTQYTSIKSEVPTMLLPRLISIGSDFTQNFANRWMASIPLSKNVGEHTHAKDTKDEMVILIG